MGNDVWEGISPQGQDKDVRGFARNPRGFKPLWSCPEKHVQKHDLWFLEAGTSVYVVFGKNEHVLFRIWCVFWCYMKRECDGVLCGVE